MLSIIYRTSFAAFFLFVTVFSKGQENSLLWRISGKGIKEPSFLYGTIHLTDERLKSFDSTFLARIDSCELLTGELILDEQNLGANMLAMTQEIMMPSDTTLEDLYESKAEFKVVNHAIDSLMGPMGMMLKRMKPFYIMAMFGNDVFEELKKGNEMGETVDQYFQNYAKSKGIEVKGLEEVGDQLKAVNAVPLKEQAELLYETIANPDSSEYNDPEQFLELYLNQDLTELGEMILTLEEDGKIVQELYVKRNYTMTKRIVELSESKSTFHTFGAGHLIGEEGVINLLKEKGFTVSPVKFEFKID